MGLCEGQRFDKSERTLIFKDIKAHGVKIKSFVTLCLLREFLQTKWAQAVHLGSAQHGVSP